MNEQLSHILHERFRVLDEQMAKWKQETYEALGVPMPEGRYGISFLPEARLTEIPEEPETNVQVGLTYILRPGLGVASIVTVTNLELRGDAGLVGYAFVNGSGTVHYESLEDFKRTYRRLDE